MKEKIGVAFIFFYENIHEKDNRILFLQWKKIKKIISDFSKNEIRFYPVILNYGQVGVFPNPLPNDFFTWDVSFKAKFPAFILKNCQRFILFPKEIIPAKRDIFYLLNANSPFLLIKPQAKSALSQIALDLKPAHYGILLINKWPFAKLKKPISANHGKSFYRYKLIDRIFLTAYFSKIPIIDIQGRSLAFPNRKLWQSWKLLFEFFKLWRKRHPLPTLSLKSLHFRLIATEIIFLLAVLFAPWDFFWLYILVGFLLAYDYFLPKKLSHLLVRILFLPFV